MISKWKKDERDENIDCDKIFMMRIPSISLSFWKRVYLQTNKNRDWPCNIESNSRSTCLQSCPLCALNTDTLWTAEYNFWGKLFKVYFKSVLFPSHTSIKCASLTHFNTSKANFWLNWKFSILNEPFTNLQRALAVS